MSEKPERRASHARRLARIASRRIAAASAALRQRGQTAYWKLYWGWHLGDRRILGPVLKRIQAEWTARRMKTWRSFSRTDPKRLLPDGESLETVCIWVLEVFSPANVENLIRGLEKLGVTSRPGRDETVRESVQKARQRPGGSAWAHVATLRRRGNAGFGMSPVVTTDLPPSFATIDLSIYTLTPSLSILIAELGVAPEARQRLDNAMRRTYAPDIRPHWDGSVSSATPDDVREREVLRVRRDLRDEAGAWVGSPFPGSFSRMTRNHRLPAAELVLSNHASLLSDETPRDGYLDAAGFRVYPFDPPISSPALGPLRLAFGEPWPSDERDAFMVIGANREVALASTPHMEMTNREESGLVYLVSEAMRKDFATLALIRLLEATHTRLATLRDLKPLKRTSARSTIKRLKESRQLLLEVALDARATSRELRELAKERGGLEHDSAGWSRNVERDGATSAQTLIEMWRGEIVYRADQLEEIEGHVRDALTLDATALGAIADLRIQRWLLPIGVIATGAAIASVIVTIIKT